MKVAIIGAGVSGLACALKLKESGIIPAVFEARSRVGDAICRSCVSLRIFTRSFHDYFHYINKSYGLELKPLHVINKIIMHAPGKTVCMHGKLGHSILRGIDPLSIENQIAAAAGIDIIFEKYVEISQIEKDFDKIVVAAGNNIIPEKLGAWTDTFTAMARFATVLGEFDPGTAEIWFDTRYAKSTFCYLIPVSTREASIVLVVNDIQGREIDVYWNEFLEIEKLNCQVIEVRDEVHKCGNVSPYNKGNIYFTGNAAGLTDDFVGFGLFNAMESGILAARAIAENLDYNGLISPIGRNVKAISEYRKVINNFDNKNFSTLLSFLNFPPVKYYIYNNPFFRASQGQHLIRAINKRSQKQPH